MLIRDDDKLSDFKHDINVSCVLHQDKLSFKKKNYITDMNEMVTLLKLKVLRKKKKTHCV